MFKKRIHDFEDQTVVDFSFNQGKICLGIRCWNARTDQTTNVSVIFSDVTNLKISEGCPPGIRIVTDDGEIIHFEVQDEHHLLLIILWHYRGKRAMETGVYNFDFGSLQIHRKMA